jgi:hypothetical protein
MAKWQGKSKMNNEKLDDKLKCLIEKYNLNHAIKFYEIGTDKLVHQGVDWVQISNQVYDAVIVCSAFAVFAQSITLNTLVRTKQALFLSIFSCIAIYELVATRHKRSE